MNTFFLSVEFKSGIHFRQSNTENPNNPKKNSDWVLPDLETPDLDSTGLKTRIYKYPENPRYTQNSW